MKFKRIEYSIISDEIEDGLPTFFVLKSTYYLGVNMVGRLYGQDGGDVPFQELESAEQFKIMLCGGEE